MYLGKQQGNYFSKLVNFIKNRNRIYFTTMPLLTFTTDYIHAVRQIYAPVSFCHHGFIWAKLDLINFLSSLNVRN